LYGNNTHSVNFRLPFLLALPWRSTTEAHMSGNRRKFLIAAGGVGLALVGVGGVFVATRRPSRGLRAWAQAETTTSDVRLDAFRRAILAPNPHNRQPWQIRLVGDDTAIITCDLERRLPRRPTRSIARSPSASAAFSSSRGSRPPSGATGWT
jgi:hypothetical protein